MLIEQQVLREIMDLMEGAEVERHHVALALTVVRHLRGDQAWLVHEADTKTAANLHRRRAKALMKAQNVIESIVQEEYIIGFNAR